LSSLLELTEFFSVRYSPISGLGKRFVFTLELSIALYERVKLFLHVRQSSLYLGVLSGSTLEVLLALCKKENLGVKGGHLGFHLGEVILN
jgi:hypothetical protein